MEIRPSEIDFVEEIGSLDNSPVKLVRLIGGFWVALGKPKSKKQDEALAAGSHPAIVKYNIEKQFQNFQPTLAKSESNLFNEQVTGYSELLPSHMRNSGYEMFLLEDATSTQYLLTRHGSEVHKFSIHTSEDSIKIEKSEKSLPSELKGFSKAVTEVVAKKAEENGISHIEYQGKKFKVQKG